MAPSSLFCSRKVSFIRELLLVLFVCFLISKNKEFTKMVGGREEKEGEGKGRGGSDPSLSWSRLGFSLAPRMFPPPPRPCPPFRMRKISSLSGLDWRCV